MSRIAFIATAVLVATSASAWAHETKASIDARELRQLGQIEQGRQTGSITWTEGLKLRAEQKRIAAMEAAFVEDGRLTKREKRVLRKMQDEASHNIADEANDNQRRRFLPRFGR